MIQGKIRYFLFFFLFSPINRSTSLVSKKETINKVRKSKGDYIYEKSITSNSIKENQRS